MTSPRVHIETYGCSFNVADGETIAGILLADGFEISETSEGADAVVVNTCTVKDRTYLNFEKRLSSLKGSHGSGNGPAVVLAGCIPKANRGNPILDGVAALGPDTLDHVGEIVRGAIAGNPMQKIRAPRSDSQRAPRLQLPSVRRNPTVEILPISSGCLSACTFCQTRLARGRLVSFSPEDILNRAQRAIGEGVKQLWITSQDTGVYGKDCNWTLARLLERLCRLEGDFRIRLGMTSPIWIHQDLEAILEAIDHPKMFKFLHLPLQSGSDQVLAHMKRGNTARQFTEIAAAFCDRFPEGTLMTDIIVGYPTETESDFLATMELLQQTKPVAVNRSRFSPRPGTAAATLPQLPSKTISERCARLNMLVPQIAAEYHQRQVGKTEPVLTSETNQTNTIAYNHAWRPVIIPGRLPLGQWASARYISASDFHLTAEIK